PLAPVEAGLADRTARMVQHVGPDLQFFGQEARAIGGPVDFLFLLPVQPRLNDAFRHLHAGIAPHLVIADPIAPNLRYLQSGAHTVHRSSTARPNGGMRTRAASSNRPSGTPQKMGSTSR